jgi:hypothetical protein
MAEALQTAVAGFWRWFRYGYMPKPLGYGIILIGGLVTAAVGYKMGEHYIARPAETADITAGNDGDIVFLQPEEWIGTPFPLLPYIDIGEQLSGGEWTVLLYHAGCPSCDSALHIIKKRAFSLSARAAVVEVRGASADEATPPESGVDGPESFLIRGSLCNAFRWFVETPVVLRLCAGKVVSVQLRSLD